MKAIETKIITIIQNSIVFRVAINEVRPSFNNNKNEKIIKIFDVFINLHFLKFYINFYYFYEIIIIIIILLNNQYYYKF